MMQSPRAASAAALLMCAASLGGCATTGSPSTASTASAISTRLTQVHNALSIAGSSVDIAIATGEISGADAIKAKSIIGDVQAALAAGQGTVAVGSAPNLAAQLAALQALLQQLYVLAPKDAKLIGDLETVILLVQVFAPAPS